MSEYTGPELVGLVQARAAQIKPPKPLFSARRLRMARCDKCGGKADAVHFLDCWPEDGKPLQALFSCSKHDFGGYWADFKRFCDPKEKFAEHVYRKVWGAAAIAALNERLSG